MTVEELMEKGLSEKQANILAKNGRYWEERFALLEQSQNKKAADCYADIERQYRLAEKNLEGQISVWYQRFADNNQISLADARKILAGKDLEEFKWDVSDYIRHGEENALNGQWAKQLENASARYHISRLEALKLQCQQQVEALFGNQLDSIDATMRDIYTDGYFRTAFEFQKGAGIGWNFATIDESKIGKVINKPWAADGKNFSSRLWENRQKMVGELHTALTQGIITGQGPQKTIDIIKKKLNTSRSVAGRLVMTEGAFFSSAAQKDSYAELGVEQYQILATLDSSTSEICRELDGMIFQMSQWDTGVTAPPFHPNCRTTTVPYDEDFVGIGERAARDEDGNTYYVPANMTYRQWEKSFVDGDKSGLQTIPKHKPPEYLEKIDYSNINMVKLILKSYEDKIVGSDIENAIVITNDGQVVQCFGNLNGAYPDTDLGNRLQKAYVTHNHPVGSANEYSFSAKDIELFIDYDLRILRGVDGKYIYELNRDGVDIDQQIDISNMSETGDDYRHNQVIKIATELGIGYRRVKRE